VGTYYVGQQRKGLQILSRREVAGMEIQKAGVALRVGLLDCGEDSFKQGLYILVEKRWWSHQLSIQVGKRQWDCQV
jgi:hypothetical protein